MTEYTVTRGFRVLEFTLALLPLACGGSQTQDSSADKFDRVALSRPAPVIVQGAGFLNPAAAVHDREADLYLVSNVNGDPAEKDDNGFISQVSPEGKVINLKWIDGALANKTLHAPKGIAVSDSRVFVADIDTIRIFHRTTGAALGTIRVPKATYLNGLSAAPNGTLYVSDTGLKPGEAGLEPSGSDAVYQVSKYGALKRLAKGEELNRPSGLAADDQGVWVASWLKAELYRITKWGKRNEAVKAPTDQLQGMARLPDGTTLLSSAKTATVYVGHPGATFNTATDRVPFPGGLGYDAKRRRALIPQLKANTLLIQELSGFEETSGKFEE